MSTHNYLLAQYHHHSKTTIVLSTLATISIALAPAAYRDYKTFMSYGPGGVPYNAFGWLIASVVLRPMTSEMFSTKVYDGQEDKGTWLSEGLTRRKGERPNVGPHAAPQRQLNQVPGNEIQKVSFLWG